MTGTGPDPGPTRLMSTLLKQMADETGYLVRLHPVAMGDGILSLDVPKVVIGRDQECQVALDDPDVSRRHAEIAHAAGQYRIKDLGSTNGTIVNDRKTSESSLSSGDVIRLGKTIFKFLRGSDVEKQYHETVYSMMITDALTGIPNRRFLREALDRELTRAHRHQRPLSVAIIDLDHFKAVNDKYGHLAGDAVLREVCSRIRGTVRKDEVFARYGGEEFAMVLPESTLPQAAQFSERVRQLVAKQPVGVDQLRIPITVSIGVAHTAGEELSPEELFSRADKKLYQAKSAGRNRVVWE